MYLITLYNLLPYANIIIWSMKDRKAPLILIYKIKGAFLLDFNHN